MYWKCCGTTERYIIKSICTIYRKYLIILKRLLKNNLNINNEKLINSIIDQQENDSFIYFWKVSKNQGLIVKKFILQNKIIRFVYWVKVWWLGNNNVIKRGNILVLLWHQKMYLKKLMIINGLWQRHWILNKLIFDIFHSILLLLLINSQNIQ